MEKLINLTKLTIVEGKLINTTNFDKIKNLTYLSLERCKNIKLLDNIKNLTNLKTFISIDNGILSLPELP
jgi:hypothetical protein